MLKSIAAVASNWGIGKDGDLLFSLPTDMKFFRQTTAGGVVIMGRKTLESFPGGRPLPKRVNIVVTRNPDYSPEGAIVVHSVEEAVVEAEKHEGEKFVIGGGEIYSKMLNKCGECLITKVQSIAEADTFFPDLDAHPDWVLAEEGEEIEENGLKFKFTTYKRK